MKNSMWWKKGAAAAATLLLASGAAPAQDLADGVIVKLRNAPAHADVALEKAKSLDRRSVRGEAAQQVLQRVLRETALDVPAIDVPSAARTRPTGRDAQVVHYDRMLGKDAAERMARRLRQRADVEWAVPNTMERRLAFDRTKDPQDPLFNSGSLDAQWWLLPVQGANGNALNARLRGVPGFQTAWFQRGNGIGMAAAPVAVLDTGITPHPDLDSTQILPGYDFVTSGTTSGDGDGDKRDADPTDTGDFCGTTDSIWHGTKIAGLIAAHTNNTTGVAGIHWAGRILPVRVAGRCGALLSDLIDGVRWAAGLHVDGVPDNPVSNRARVINISFGSTNACDSAYQSAINDVRAAGAVVVVAAGNEHTAPTRPANCSNVIGVGALNRDGFKTAYSNFGSQLVISTVGGDAASEGNWGTPLANAGRTSLADSGILTISNDGETTQGSATYEYVFGTSFAAPLVSGTVSLMLGINPSLTADQIVQGLKVTARRHVTSAYIQACSDANPGRCICTTSTCGAGILDADQALAYAAAPTTYTRPASLDTVVPVDSLDVINAVAFSATDLAANNTTTTPVGPCGRDGICGGAFQPAWLLGLLAATALLWRQRRKVAQAG